MLYRAVSVGASVASQHGKRVTLTAAFLRQPSASMGVTRLPLLPLSSSPLSLPSASFSSLPPLRPLAATQPKPTPAGLSAGLLRQSPVSQPALQQLGGVRRMGGGHHEHEELPPTTIQTVHYKEDGLKDVYIYPSWHQYSRRITFVTLILCMAALMMLGRWMATTFEVLETGQYLLEEVRDRLASAYLYAMGITVSTYVGVKVWMQIPQLYTQVVKRFYLPLIPVCGVLGLYFLLTSRATDVEENKRKKWIQLGLASLFLGGFIANAGHFISRQHGGGVLPAFNAARFFFILTAIATMSMFTFTYGAATPDQNKTVKWAGLFFVGTALFTTHALLVSRYPPQLFTPQQRNIIMGLLTVYGYNSLIETQRRIPSAEASFIKKTKWDGANEAINVWASTLDPKAMLCRLWYGFGPEVRRRVIIQLPENAPGAAPAPAQPALTDEEAVAAVKEHAKRPRHAAENKH